jgi:aspartyl-tRNA(Asn)/glutamyl-tRNA(Gln) amidotransferase subunit A
MRQLGIDLSIAGLALAFGSGTLSPVDVLKQQLLLIEKTKETLNAFVFLPDPEVLHEQAECSEARWRKSAPLGPFDGVPVTIKDMIWVAGWPTRAGSKTTDPNRTAEQDAPCVARLREQGALILGKTATSEFGWKAVCDSPYSGVTRNPFDLALTPSRLLQLAQMEPDLFAFRQLSVASSG